MTHPIIKTDNYILIVENSEKPIIGKWYYNSDTKNLFVIVNDYPIPKSDIVIAHLPLNSPILEGVTLLPSLTNEEDVDELAEQEYSEQTKSYEDDVPEPFYNYPEYLKVGFITGYNKAKEKYKFTEEDIIKVIDYCKYNRAFEYDFEKVMESISQPRLPVGFKCGMGITPSYKDKLGNIRTEKKYPKIINGVMQGEWIFE